MSYHELNWKICTKSQKASIRQLISERGDCSVISVCTSENPLRVRVGMFAQPRFHYALYVGKRGKVYEEAWGDL